MNNNILNINFSDLKITPNSVYRELNYKKDSVPEEFEDTVLEELAFAKENFEARIQYLTTSDFSLSKNLIIRNQTFEIGLELVDILNNSKKLTLFIATAGERITIRNTELLKKENHLEAYANDVIGNIIVEKTADFLLKSIKYNNKTTNRYSPGNCGWETMNQKGFFSLFPKISIGVTLSDMQMMTPIKSLNGIIGIGENVNYKSNTCLDCPSTNCLYRKG